MKPFLACGIPQLHAESFVVDVDCFGDEVHADCGLSNDDGYLLVAGEIVENETVDDGGLAH